jgi:kumamolisin
MRPLAGLIALSLPAVAALAASPAFAAQADGRVALHGEVISAVSNSAKTGEVASDKKVPVTISLTPRNQKGLDAFIAKVGDKKSAQYKHYLTVNQFAARYGATSATIAKVTKYLRSQGLTTQKVTANHLTLSASGSAAQVEKAFGTTLATYKEKGTNHAYFANTSAPRLPAGIASAVSDVSGLNSYAKYHHNTQKAKAVSPKVAAGLNPTTSKKAYNLTSTVSAGYDGSGETVGLLEFSAFKQANITYYDNYYGISPATPTVRTADGGTTDLSGQGEVELDIEVVQALAPGANIKVYEAPNSDAGETAVYSALVSDDVPVVSISWGIYESGETSSNRTALNTDFQEAAAQGQSVFAASGDSGSDDAGDGGTSVDFPASDPYVTGTGGTTLTTSSGTWSKETAWSGSGGGVSSIFSRPSYQTSSINSSSYRGVPDVAADANPSSGWAIYSAGAWAEYGGTSAAAPNWAAFTAVLDDEADATGGYELGYANSTIYALATSSSYSSAFHDVTSGNNGDYSAATGYDKVTGWGSYNGAKFIAAEL